MAAGERMSDAMLARVAEQFRALAEPSRLRLMSLLFDAAHTVGELVERSGLTLANVSKHLGILHHSGWVTRRRDGAHVWYELADARAASLCEMMCERVQRLAAASAAELLPPSGPAP